MHTPSNRPARCLLAGVIGALLAGCTVNGIRPLRAGAPVDEGRAVVVFGVGVEGDWHHAGYATQFDEYDVKAGAITGNCVRFNRMSGAVPSLPAPVRHFAFDVPAGAYVYSGFNGARLAAGAAKTLAYAAPAGRVVYLGDFIYTKQGAVSVRSDLDAAQRYLSAAHPELRGAAALADAFSVPPPRLFLCTP